MAKVAEEMGVGVMSIYHYFSSKINLLDSVSDVVFARFVPPDTNSDLETAIGAWVNGVCDFFSRNPIALDLINWDSHTSPAWLRVSLPMLRILSNAGFRGHSLALGSRWLISVVMGVVTTKQISVRSTHPALPRLASLSSDDHALIDAINVLYDKVPEATLIEIVSHSVMTGLRKIVAEQGVS